VDEKACRIGLAACLLFWSVSWVSAQRPNEQNTPLRPPRRPDIADVRYGPYERNDLDVYLAKSEKPTPLVMFFHGGAWVVGNKYLVPIPLLDACQKAGITVAAINYRYVSAEVKFPGPFLDAARALQFLRLHAKEYNLNPNAVASTGASAGADMSLWLGFHKDLAEPASDDPVKRQSTRISAVGAMASQTTLDPRVVAKMIGQAPAVGFARSFYGLGPDMATWDSAAKWFDDASAVINVAKDSPPVFLYYSVPNRPITADTPGGDRVHHPIFGFLLKERMDKLGVECVLRLAEDYAASDHGNPVSVKVNQDMVDFFLRHFPK